MTTSRTWCAGCGPTGPANRLCADCRRGLVPASPRALPSGVLVRGAWRHTGAARSLVLALKYRAMPGAATLLATGMVARLPAGAQVLVPVPRARLRVWRHGVDPARELAAALGRVAGVPTMPALVAAWWWPPHAGRDRSARDPPRFVARHGVAGAVLVDDVLTTGATLEAAARAIGPGVIGAVTATARDVE